MRSCKLRSPCRCGSSNGLILPGTAPHRAALRCWDCGRFIRWLGKNDYARAQKLGLINDVQELEAIADSDMSVVVKA